MRIPHIYTPQPLAPGATIALEASAARHVHQVLRLRPGEALSLFNGDQRRYEGRLLHCDRQQLEVEIISVTEGLAAPPLHFTLALGISKGERMEYALQKAVELGIGCFIPLFTERTVVKLQGDRLARRLAHWQKIAIAASEQSGRNDVPVIEPAQRLAQWITESGPGARLVLHPGAGQSLNRLPAPDGAVQLLIGPEGGLSADEVRAAEANGFTPIRLGPRILRTETAPVAALAAMQMLWGDFR